MRAVQIETGKVSRTSYVWEERIVALCEILWSSVLL